LENFWQRRFPYLQAITWCSGAKAALRATGAWHRSGSFRWFSSAFYGHMHLRRHSVASLRLHAIHNLPLPFKASSQERAVRAWPHVDVRSGVTFWLLELGHYTGVPFLVQTFIWILFFLYSLIFITGGERSRTWRSGLWRGSVGSRTRRSKPAFFCSRYHAEKAAKEEALSCGGVITHVGGCVYSTPS